MSHVTVVKTVIKEKDLPILKEVLEEIGCQLKENVTSYKTYGNNGKPAGLKHAIAVKNNADAYEAALVQKEEGVYELQYDFYGMQGHLLRDKIGASGKNFLHPLGVRKCVLAAKQAGFRIEKLETNTVGNKLETTVLASPVFGF